MTKKKVPTQPSFDAQKAIDQAERDFAEATEAEDILDAVSRGVWIKDHQTKSPKTAIATPLAISLWCSGFGDNEKEDFIRAFTQNNDMATVWAKRWTKKEMALEWPIFVRVTLLALSEPPTSRDKKPGDSIDVEDVIKYLKTIGMDMPKEADKPLSLIVRAWQNRPRKPEQISVGMVGDGLTSLPYGVSEISRNRWEEIEGSIDAVIVDGQPLATHIPEFKTRQRRGKLKAYKPGNTQGQLSLGFPFSRQPLGQPIPLIAYSEFGGDLHKSIAADVSVLLFLAHASNQPLFLSHKDGARLLARNRQGGFRKKINRRDVQRFVDAWVAVWSMMVWVEKNGLFIPYDMAICSRVNDEAVTLAKPLWSRRENGQWTLTAGYGAVGKNRLFGKIDDGGIWRTIAGIEYYLARGYPAIQGKNKDIAQPLVAASKGGPGEWQKVDWRTFMRLTGDNWDKNDKTKDSTVNRRFSRRKEVLKAAGYVTDGRNPATASDTVEFLFGKKGMVWFRATDRFVEAARLAKEQKWETVNLQNFLTGN
ncbi:MAG: hypothetical protein OXI94_08310 [Gemmatimonadota bacterium]|nr:hypothetical protein [Gemmatimonadota bacterium]